MTQSKLKAAAHYVIAKSDPSRLGAIRLNKILWYADTLAYRANGASITNETYVKRQYGPVPKHILLALGELEEEGAIITRTLDKYGKQMREHIAMKPPETSVLSVQEIEMIEDMRGVICDHFSANGISELSHDQIWEAANIGEIIPMSATLASSPGEITSEVLKWADDAIARFEKQVA